jgi:hypothetical protein
MLTGSYATEAEHEAALNAAEAAGMIALRVIKAPFQEWETILEHLATQGDLEGNLWEHDRELNARLRVVAPARNMQTCWFSLFLTAEVYAGLAFIDGVYDLGRGELSDSIPELTGALAIRDLIFMRRGQDHGALVEIHASTSDHPDGYAAIEDANPAEMWRLTYRLSRRMESFLDIQKGTRIAIRTRYRPRAKLTIHTVMIATKARSMGMQWKIMHKLRSLNLKTLNYVTDGRQFRIVDFTPAEGAFAPLNAGRAASQQAQDLATQGCRCTMSNLPPACDEDRLARLMASRELHLSGPPVIIDSKFKPGTRVAFLTFQNEHMALTAILDAPFMIMSGATPIIKPSAPKANRSLSAHATEEQKQGEALGPTDGMTETQLTGLFKHIDDASAIQLTSLKSQFKFDDRGSFANGVVNAFKTAILKVMTDFQDVKNELLVAYGTLQTVVEEDLVEREATQVAVFNAVADVSDNQAAATATVLQALATIAGNQTAQTAAFSAQFDDISFRLDNIETIMQGLTFGELGPHLDPREEHQPPPDFGHDSDDSDMDQGGHTQEPAPTAQQATPPVQEQAPPTTTAVQQTTTQQATQRQATAQQTTAPQATALATPTPQATEQQGTADHDATQKDTEAPAPATHGPTTPNRFEQILLPPTRTPTPKTSPVLTQTQILSTTPPQAEVTAHQGKPAATQPPRANVTLDANQHVLPSPPTLTAHNRPTATPPDPITPQAQITNSRAFQPLDLSLPDPTVKLTQKRKPGSPEHAPNTKQKPALTHAEAEEAIFRLCQTNPDNESLQDLQHGSPGTLVQRGLQAQFYLDNPPPSDSPMGSTDSEWHPTPTNLMAAAKALPPKDAARGASNPTHTTNTNSRTKANKKRNPNAAQ